jgi:hypothetical protein
VKGEFWWTEEVNQNVEVQERRPRSGWEVEQLVNEFEVSGARVTDFCSDHKLSRRVLYRHLEKRRLGKVEAKPRQGLVAVSVVEGPGQPEATVIQSGTSHLGLASEGVEMATGDQCALEIVVRSGQRIRVRPDFDSGTLERVLNILEKA